MRGKRLPLKRVEQMPKAPPHGLSKAETGIRGFDEITFGGVPRGRTTLLCGAAGCGKTLFGMEFLIRGATEYDEPGVCLSFDETGEDLAANVASLGFDLNDLAARKLIAIDHIYIERSQIEETGAYDLEGLFLRLGHAVDTTKAKRVLLDSLETLFAGIANESILRAELRRLFSWMKERGLTAVVTAERGENSLTRHGIEEYISDCVILLDHRVTESVTTRRLRVVKYRGSSHGTNEYPFLIDTDGISVLPLTSLELNHAASDQRVSTGISALDSMLGGEGYFRGSSILLSGTAGTGKTSLAAHFVAAACARGERCLFFSFEESATQILRNTRSIGLNLGQWVDKGILRFQAARPSTFGLEMHLVMMHKLIAEFNPSIVVVDPLTALINAGAESEAQSMVLRLVDFLKSKGITALMTSLVHASEPTRQTDIQISSIVDAWISLRDIESSGERNRGLYVLKARGLSHSNQIREFVMTDKGIQLRDVYLGAEMLTGSARIAQEAKDATAMLLAAEESQRSKAILERRSKVLESQIAALQLELESEGREMRHLSEQDELRTQKLIEDQRVMQKSRAAVPEFIMKSAKKGGSRK
jgi:circadian clock protein KaiC